MSIKPHSLVKCKAPEPPFLIRIAGTPHFHKFGDVYEVQDVLHDEVVCTEFAGAFEEAPRFHLIEKQTDGSFRVQWYADGPWTHMDKELGTLYLTCLLLNDLASERESSNKQ